MQYPGHEALDPFFAAIKRMIGDRVDGEHFFDMLANEVVWEYGFIFPGTASHVYGRQALVQHFSGYHKILWLESVGDEIVHPTPDGVILEYRSHGRGTQTGRPYSNQYVSVLTIRDRAVVHWRDYSNKLAVIETVGDVSKVGAAMGSQA